MTKRKCWKPSVLRLRKGYKGLEDSCITKIVFCSFRVLETKLFMSGIECWSSVDLGLLPR